MTSPGSTTLHLHREDVAEITNVFAPLSWPISRCHLDLKDSTKILHCKSNYSATDRWYDTTALTPPPVPPQENSFEINGTRSSRTFPLPQQEKVHLPITAQANMQPKSWLKTLAQAGLKGSSAPCCAILRLSFRQNGLLFPSLVNLGPAWLGGDQRFLTDQVCICSS